MTQKESGRKIHSSRKPAGFFAITAPGLEELLAEEILQLTGRHGETSSGGVAFQGGLKDMRRLNLWSRIANRVLVRADEFHASSFHELERRAKQVGWERFVSVGHAVRFRVTCRESRLYHSDAVAERLAASVNARVGGNERLKQVPSRRPEREATDTAADVTIDDEENAYGEQLFIVRIANDTCSISADSSGELLHRRGYRQAVAKAPLRETIAAAMVVASGWDMASPLVDPMCGAGTIAIEAAMIARRIPPGASRRFAFEHWPRHDAKVWQAEVDAARAESLPRAAGRIIASDRDEGAVEAARSNAERAGVSKDIEFSARALSAAELPEQDGWVVTNPPYGMRLGDTAPLRNLYAQLGTIMRSRASGYRIALLSADSELEDQMKMELTEVFRTSNGGIPVHLVAG